MRWISLILSYTLISFNLSAQHEGILLLKSIPAGAIVVLNGKEIGKVTPYQDLLPEGNYIFSLNLPLYRHYEGTLAITRNEASVLEIKLTPAFGTLKIITEPAGADIELDGVATGRKTPFLMDKVPSGIHQITVRQNSYRKMHHTATVNDGKITDLTFDLEPLFGTVAIVTDPEADILINSKKVGNAMFTGRLDSGKYVIEARLDGYSTGRREVEIIPGSEERLSIKINPRLGTLAVMTVPPELEVYVDGQRRGLSPIIIPGLIIGTHVIEISTPEKKTKKYHAEISEEQITRLEIDVNQTPSATAINHEEQNGAGGNAILSEEKNQPGESPPPPDGIYIIADEMPKFPGGDLELWKFIRLNLHYPVEARDRSVQGRVILRFCINEIGAIDKISVMKSLDPLLDEEAIRVIRLLPAWVPGRNAGKPVKVWYTIPISFKII